MSALNEKNLVIPRDIAVASFDDIEFGKLFHPGLTTLNHSSSKIGEEAVKLLLASKNAPKKSSRSKNIRIPIMLEIRESCGCTEQSKKNP